MLDLVIRGGNVATEFGIFQADIGVEEGRISKVARLVEEPAERIINAGGKLVIPGGIDGHVHFAMHYSDGVYTADDFYSGTVAAACGGITTVIDFATPERGQSFIDAFVSRRRQADGEVAVDYGLHLSVVSADARRLAELEELYNKHGVASIKVFTAYRRRGLMLDDGAILDVLREASRLGTLVLAHCENEDIINRNVERFLSKGKTGVEYHGLSRPDYVEAEAIRRLSFFTGLTGAMLLVVHLSSGMGLEAVREARRGGARVYAETCPHYLMFDDSVYRSKDAALYLMSPPLKSPRDREALWDGVVKGGITVMGSDHACFTAKVKRRSEIFTEIPGGVQGTENIIPILYSEGVAKGRLSIERFVALVSANPAKLYGLYPCKGAILPGSDADLTIIDPNMKVKLGRDAMHSRLDHSIYEGIEVRGYPTEVVSRGRVIVENREFVGQRGWGRYLARRGNPKTVEGLQ
ncbi:MAG: dihydropyrimidinase [Aigarchaeota archaeon]|nr:dihydropyrimidinase [Candidatus Pelearchaeum maunauluense]